MNTKRLVRIALLLVLTILGGFIRVPFGSTYFTFQTLFVLLSGIFLGAKDGIFCQICYLILGLVGIPIFANGGGIFYFMQPSFGYLIAFPLSAFMVGRLLFAKLKTISIVKIWLVCVLSLLPIYLIGGAYQVVILTTVYSLEITATITTTILSLLPLLAFDIILCLVLALIVPKINNETNFISA